jgi:hypothetical protein
LLKVIDCIEILKKLDTKNPVFVSFFLARTVELPRSEHKLTLRVVSFLHEAHVSFFGHFEFFSFSRFVSNKVEFDADELLVLLFFAEATLFQHGHGALDTTLTVDSEDEIDEGLFRSHSDRHTVVEKDLMELTFDDVDVSKFDTVRIEAPVIRITRLFSPENVFFGGSWFGVSEVISTEDHFTLCIFVRS